MNLVEQIAQELEWSKDGVKSAIEMFDRGISLHFIARYRKDKTQGLNPDQLRILKSRLEYLRKLKESKTKAIEKLKSLGKISDYLLDAIKDATTLSDINEIMQPYKTKRKTRANKARNKGLQPVADIILGKTNGKIKTSLNKIEGDNKELLKMSLDIVAEESVSHPRCKRTAENNILNSKVIIDYEEDKDKDKTYVDLQNITSNARKLSPHQIHALFRAEEEGIIKLKFDVNLKTLIKQLKKLHIFNPGAYEKYYIKGLIDGTKRLLLPRAERSARNLLKEIADKRAIEVFKQNLEDLLLQPPIRPQVIIGIDPGFRSGCKVAVIGPEAELLDFTTIYPTPPKNDIQNSGETLERLILEFDVTFIAIGNGTGSNETMQFVRKMLREKGLAKINFAIIPETGASVYSASKIAEEEFPGLESAERGAISIARRVLDPLAEYVKIDPKSLGVGQYQHDVDEKELEQALNFVVDKCVNTIGINLRTASRVLLEHVSGLNSTVAKNIVNYRLKNGFSSLEELYQVYGLGDSTYEQSVGFLKLPESVNILDNTLIHPDHYDIAEKMIENMSKNVFSWRETKIKDREQLISQLSAKDYITNDIGKEIITDIMEELVLFGKDIRGIKEFHDLSKQPSDIEELRIGMTLEGEIRNTVDFGAFVDLGIKENGLIHISKLSDRYVSNVRSVVKIGDTVKVKIIDLDLQRKRISLKLLEVNGQQPR